MDCLAVGSMSVGVTLDCAGAAPLPSHTALRISRPRLLVAGCTLIAYSLASMPLGNWMRKHSMPSAIRRSATLAAPRSPASSRS